MRLYHSNFLTYFRFALLTCGFLHALSNCFSVERDVAAPRIALPSDEGKRAIRRFHFPVEMTVELFAAEPNVANPVSFAFDEKGRIFVAESFRQRKGVEENGDHPEWLLDDLAAQSVEDRIRFLKKHCGEGIQKFAIEQDRIRLLEDTDADGKCDRSSVFADRFNHIEEGTGAGVLSFNGTTYYACIPRLWKLTASNDEGQAAERHVLLDGFGVRVAHRGHDLHGLTVGPDGRLYFSIGDRGFNVEIPTGRLAMPDQGAVFRCELDGSDLEVIATGLRNPQELAFDDFGNLFTCDNDSDGGDLPRWIYLIEGSDSGWRMHFQYLEDRGIWLREKLWQPGHFGQAAYIVPPIANIGNGPAGLTYYPGTGMGEGFRGHFFLADFRGTAANSGIHCFSTASRGASFELVNDQRFIWSILATDVDFGFDGCLYVSDWVETWEGSGKGRIYRFQDRHHANSTLVTEVRQLMKDGFKHLSPTELAELMSHPDYRIRQRAQFTLVDQRAAVELTHAATNGKQLFGKLHGIWGLGQLARKQPEILIPILKIADSHDVEVRCQLARVCGDAKLGVSEQALLKLLDDSNPRVRSLAAIALGKLKSKASVEPLFRLLAEIKEADPTLRHAAIMGLVGAADIETLRAASHRLSPDERMGAVLAMRRHRNPALAEFLNDRDPLVVLEAARAIHDLPVLEAFPALAKLRPTTEMSDSLLRRIVNAHFRLGNADNAVAVLAIAANPNFAESIQLEAITALRYWNTPPALDLVLNDYRPLPARQIDIATIVRPAIRSLFSGTSAVRERTVELAAKCGLSDLEPLMLDVFHSNSSPVSERLLAIKALESLKSERLRAVVDDALTDADETIRSEARRILATLAPEHAVELLESVLQDSSIPEQQAAFLVLATIDSGDVDRILSHWLRRLSRNEVPVPIQLDLMEAARTRGTTELMTFVNVFESRRNHKDLLSEYRETLEGGDAKRGHQIFWGRIEVSCRRCHKINGQGGEVGPDLSRIGLEKTREYLLESIVEPNRRIAKGFEAVNLQMVDGRVYAGIIQSEDEMTITLKTQDQSIIVLEKTKIDERTTGKSGMPEDLFRKLTKREIRDLVEFLASLKTYRENP